MKFTKVNNNEKSNVVDLKVAQNQQTKIANQNLKGLVDGSKIKTLPKIDLSAVQTVLATVPTAKSAKTVLAAHKTAPTAPKAVAASENEN